MNQKELKFIEEHGYNGAYENRSRPIGVCLFCGSDVIKGDVSVRSFDGIFCDMDCCHSYYEIYTKFETGLD